MTFELTQDQLSGMGEALTQGGTGLLHIGIQIMPYAIAMTIIMIIFLLVKNWSKLKTDRQLKQIHRIKTKREKEEIKRYSKNNLKLN